MVHPKCMIALTLNMMVRAFDWWCVVSVEWSALTTEQGLSKGVLEYLQTVLIVTVAMVCLKDNFLVINSRNRKKVISSSKGIFSLQIFHDLKSRTGIYQICPLGHRSNILSWITPTGPTTPSTFKRSRKRTVTSNHWHPCQGGICYQRSFVWGPFVVSPLTRTIPS